jgi:hypothetical protein
MHIGPLPEIFVGRIAVRAFRLLQATLSVVATRIAHGHATAGLSIFTAFSRWAVP